MNADEKDKIDEKLKKIIDSIERICKSYLSKFLGNQV